MLKIRHAAAKDIPAISSLGNRFLKEIPAYGLVIRSEEELNKLDLNLIWVVEDAEILGYAICLPENYHGQNIFKENDKIVELDEIYLVPEIRGRGIGSQLLEAITDYVKKSGYTKFYVNSAVKDLMPVIRFYRDNGFKTWSIQLYKDLT